MKLKEYQNKRNFQVTPEPEGREESSPSGRRFLIQKHAASRMHYDLRLELGGVLKSWALPKGPSLDPGQKRLAVHVEDHPLEYGAFEGTIPKHEYGGGTVMLWDEGVWIPDGDPEEDYRKGRMHLEIQGEKLRGKWLLFKMGGQKAENDKNWLFVKSKDAYADAAPDGLLEMDRSVSTGRSMEQIAADAEPGPKHAQIDPPSVTPTAQENTRTDAMPDTVHPQLPTLVDVPPEGDRWFHEIKYDGYRIIAFLKPGSIRLVSRNGKDWTSRLLSLVHALSEFPVSDAVIDGEVVIQMADGTTSFQALQNSFEGEKKTGTLLYYVFDLLYCEGHDLSKNTLQERKNRLRKLFDKMPSGSVVRFSDHVAGSGPLVYEHACRIALEGIISKDSLSPYQQKRSRRWLKIKCQQRQEFVIGGYTEPAGSRVAFGALLLGVYDEEENFRYCGKVGTGFNQRELISLKKSMSGLERKHTPFINPPKGAEARNVHWIDPKLVAEVSFTGWTREELLRHPAYKGLREDKSPLEIRRETQRPRHDVLDENSEPEQLEQGQSSTSPSPPKTSPKQIRLTNAERVYYPELGITKADLAGYYQRISEHILPYLIRRPLSLLRCPRGRGRECFYQKHFSESLPKYVREIPIQEKKSVEKYIVIDDIHGLVSLVQLGVLEFHPWNAREDQIEKPDLIIMDLDPAPDVELAQVVEGTVLLRDFLDSIGLKSFLKTSGGKGFHVVVPLVRRTGWDEVKAFARNAALRMTKMYPDRFVATVSKKKREGKIFIDYLRNGRGATSIAPYSTRAKTGAPISTPLRWEELTPQTAPDKYRIDNIEQRLARLRTDPWEDYFNTSQSITKSMEKKVEP
ncbi:bifunctional non-homologous end joining protein LigD [Desulfonatronum thiosulfatophilum]|uniref:DNA ligase (ATP) n=1 Tax=Desulfonatronum thiosulfatophilum TaxID=617002 RepID=A0A1G6DK07_9BACT|nr:DNA ligase D [Desulfonatronum thiosulfatophilum]SDB45527.1 bifunctional non-homologous end joining protein LigD [Desulfonatronum thiosulfatophilum]